MKKAALHNLGCKVNAYETEAMREMLEEAGYEIVPFREGADIYIINTCTVTNIADRKSRQMLHRARKMNPDAVVVAAGCYVQAQEEEHQPADPCVDIVIGNNRKKDLVQILEKYWNGREPEKRHRGEEYCVREPEEGQQEEGHCVREPEEGHRGEEYCGREPEKRHRGEEYCSREPEEEHRGEEYCVREPEEGDTQGRQRKVCLSQVIDINHTEEYEELRLTKPGEHTRAYIKVQDGCNQFCSYCIIPFARGRVRSRSLDSVLEEVRRLAQSGCREVVLTGIHLSSYGIDFQNPAFLGGAGKTDLLALIRAVHGVDGILRIRLGSLEPRAITEEFVRAAAGLPKLCPHFHLSLQSGCDATLRRMNRRYTTEEYYEKCVLLRKYFDNPALTTDIIVGFPGETEEEFAVTMEFVDKVNFYETHIFKYSRRQGTRAAAMKDQVPEHVKAERSRRLLELGRRRQAAYEKSFLGKEVEVLVEECVEADGRQYQVGHTREYLKIALDMEENLQNCVKKVQIIDDLQIIH